MTPACPRTFVGRFRRAAAARARKDAPVRARRESASSRSAARRRSSIRRQIVTQLRAEGYAIDGDLRGRGSRRRQHLRLHRRGGRRIARRHRRSAGGERQGDRHRLPGREGWRRASSATAHPTVLAVTGPHATDEVMAAVHTHLPKPHDPFADLVPPQGIKLTPRHYAYLKISEGCNHRCTFCIIPAMRGDLVSASHRRGAGGSAAAARGRRAASSSSCRRTRAPTASTCATAPASGRDDRSRRG